MCSPKDWSRSELFNWSNLIFQVREQVGHGNRETKVFGLNASHTVDEVGRSGMILLLALLLGMKSTTLHIICH